MTATATAPLKVIADFIAENADKIPNKLAAATLKSWVPALLAVSTENSNVHPVDFKTLQVTKNAPLLQRFGQVATQLNGGLSFGNIKLPHITGNDWVAFYRLCTNYRESSYLVNCPQLPSTYPGCADWEMRETRRFLPKGGYEHVSWSQDLPPIPGHYVHFSTKTTDGLIAYTQNAEKGVRDIQTPIKPGKYLKQFYPDLHLDTIRDYVAMCSNDKLLTFATKADEIEHIYMNGPSSCMTYPLSHFGNHLPVHPVHAYAGGDLALACLRDRSSKILARGLVWPARKLMGRLYGDIQRLEQALRKEGYTNKANTGSDLKGARLKTVKFRPKTDPQRDYIVMPYLDGSNMNTLRFEENADWMVIGASDGVPYSVSSSTLRLPIFRECPLSKKTYDADKTPFVVLEDTKQEVARGPCMKNDLIFQCLRTQKYFSMATDHGRVATYWDRTKGSYTYEVWLAEEVAKMAYTCARTGTLLAKQYVPPVILADGSKVSPAWYAFQARALPQAA